MCCNKERGLLEHSVNVAETMLKFKETLAPGIPNKSCVIAGLLHDLGKAGVPGTAPPAAVGRRSTGNRLPRRPIRGRQPQRRRQGRKADPAPPIRRQLVRLRDGSQTNVIPSI